MKGAAAQKLRAFLQPDMYDSCPIAVDLSQMYLLQKTKHRAYTLLAASGSASHGHWAKELSQAARSNSKNTRPPLAHIPPYQRWPDSLDSLLDQS